MIENKWNISAYLVYCCKWSWLIVEKLGYDNWLIGFLDEAKRRNYVDIVK